MGGVKKFTPIVSGSSFKKYTGREAVQKSLKKIFRPELPKPPEIKAPKALRETVREVDPEARRAREDTRRRRRTGRASTILTGPSGVTGAAATTVAGSILTGKTKLGQ